MAIIPNNEKVFMVSNTTNTTYSGSQALKDMNEWYTMEDVKNTVLPYKVYTALLTQSGSAGNAFIGPGELTIGVTYMINDSFLGQDFTNVGAPNNDVGTWFVATGTTPNNWGLNQENGLIYYPGAPVVTVLENTIGNIWFNYEDLGAYGCQSNNLFTTGKTFILATPTIEANPVSIVVTNGMESVIYISPLNNDLIAFDNGLFNTPIEIRVYN
jgi:hypothetical protein